MTDAKSSTSQSAFTEQAVRNGHSMASVQMWQTFCRRLAILAPDTQFVANVLLSMSNGDDIPVLSICDDLIANGIKKLEFNAVELLHQLADAYETQGPPHERSDSSDETVPATQPMTPPPERPDFHSPKATWAPKKLKRKATFVDLTAEESD